MAKVRSDLPALLRAAGLDVVVVKGWRLRGRPGSFAPVGVLNHHIGTSAKGWSLARELAYAKWMFQIGRRDLPAPLVQIGLGRSGRVYLGAAGRANHAGKAKSSGSVSAGDGNTLYVGIEWMLSGSEVIPAVMMKAGAILNAVLTEKVTAGGKGTSVATISCHYQTSVTGKWDIGDPRGIPFRGHKVLDVGKFRKAVAAERTRLYHPAPVPPAPKPSPPTAKPTLRWNGRLLNVDSPIFAKPPKQHHWDPKVGDRLSAWNKVKAGEALDGNLVPGAGDIWFMHGFNAAQNGYNHVVATSGPNKGKVVPMTAAERQRSLDLWGAAGIKRWRDKHGQAPMTLREGLRWADRNNVYIAMEPKGPAWASDPRWFQRLRAAAEETGHPAVVKRLATLRFPKETVINAHKAKVKVAAIYGSGVKGRARRLAATARLHRAWRNVKFDATW
jgi:hypothetical protein